MLAKLKRGGVVVKVKAQVSLFFLVDRGGLNIPASVRWSPSTSPVTTKTIFRSRSSTVLPLLYFPHSNLWAIGKVKLIESASLSDDTSNAYDRIPTAKTI
jgi:hypothetical protein